MSESSEDFRLPVGASLRDIYHFLWTARRDLVLMAAIPIVSLTLYQVLVVKVLGVTHPGQQTPEGPPATLWDAILVYLPNLLLYTMFAVAWHRRFLTRGESVTVWSALRWDKRKTRFLLRSVLVFLIAIAVVSVPIVILTIFTVVINFAAAADVTPPVDVTTLSSGIIFVAAILFLLIYLRLSIWLPATAIDAPFSLMESWRLGRGNSWRLLVIGFGAEFGIWLLTVLFVLATAALPDDSLTVALITELVSTTMAYGVLAAGITALSVCYDRLLARIANDPLYTGGGMPFMDE